MQESPKINSQYKPCTCTLATHCPETAQSLSINTLTAATHAYDICIYVFHVAHQMWHAGDQTSADKVE